MSLHGDELLRLTSSSWVGGSYSQQAASGRPFRVQPAGSGVCADQSVLVFVSVSFWAHVAGRMTGRVRDGNTGANTSCCDGPKLARVQLSLSSVRVLIDRTH